MAQTKIRTEQIENLTAANITDFDTEVSNNTDVAANTSARHSAVTLAGTPDYLTIVGQTITRNAIDLTADVTGVLPAANLPDASATAEGVVELATDAEAVTGTDTARAVTPANLTARLAAPGTIGGTTPANATFADLIVNGHIYADGEVDNGNSGTADTVDWGAGNFQKSTLTGNCTFTFTAPDGPGRFQLVLVQDGTGSRTVTWPASVKWPGGTAPTLSTAASAIDIITFYYDGTSYYGVDSLNFS